ARIGLPEQRRRCHARRRQGQDVCHPRGRHGGQPAAGRHVGQRALHAHAAHAGRRHHSAGAFPDHNSVEGIERLVAGVRAVRAGRSGHQGVAMSTETERKERKLTFVIDDDALFNADKTESEPASFLELATALAQRKWFILKMTACAGVIGVMVALLLPNWYTAETKILPPQQQQSSAVALLSSLGKSSGLGTLASAAGSSLGLKNPNDLYVGMLK